jgi:hypothetical protein
VRILAGVLLTVFALGFALLFVDVFVTKLASGSWVDYLGMVTYAAATYGCAVGALRCLHRPGVVQMH